MKPRRILIIRPDRIGDVILTTPLMKAVKLSFPDCFVGVMVGTYTVPLIKENPYVDAIITDDPNGKDSGRSGFWRQVSTLRTYGFDTGLMPLPRERHAWMMLLAGIKTRIGVGGKIYQILTGTKSVSRNNYIPLRHEADYVMDLGRKVGITYDDLVPRVYLTAVERGNAKKFFTDRGIDFNKPLIGINPGSKNSSPNWLPERYVHLIEQLLKNYQIFINAGPKDSGLQKYFEHLGDRVVLYDENDLRKLMALTSQVSVLVASSTGTMHIAAALDVSTVALFCPLTACSYKLWGPLGNRSEIIEPPDRYCQGRCPGNPKICPFDEISVETVLERIEKVITS
ncbi:MAG: glycosyltransferase family 9 protein [Ignavibacteriales bacterium]|nr:glycosyltransferase family 9 protein [Ignavibacteriales bacterium]